MTDPRDITLSQMSKAINFSAALYCDIFNEGYTSAQAEQEMQNIIQYGMDNYYMGLCCCQANTETKEPQ